VGCEITYSLRVQSLAIPSAVKFSEKVNVEGGNGPGSMFVPSPRSMEAAVKLMVAWFNSSIAADSAFWIKWGGARFAIKAITNEAKLAIDACSPRARRVHSSE